MTALKPLLVGLLAATALTITPMDFNGLQMPLGIDTAEAAAATVKIDVFFQPLASHGVWVKHAKYHYVFCPKVDAKWRPYSHGHWIYMKSYGWYFASDEPFAWAVYHYGRWFHEAKLGWCWVPGNAWAGAWVAWRRSNDFIGWAPLEPTHDGFAVDVDVGGEPPQPDWIFVPPPRFLEPRLDVVVSFGDQHPDVFQKTQFVGPVVVQNNIVVNTVIDIDFIQKVTNKKVIVVDPKPVNDPSQAAPDANGNTVAVFAPQIEPPRQDEAPKDAIDEDQAQQQLGNPSEQPSSEVSSASSEQPSSEASSAASSEQPSSAASSAEPSSEASSAPASSEESSTVPSSEASSAAPSSEAMSSSTAPSSEAPALSSAEPSSAAPSSEAAPVSSASSEQAAPSSEEKAPASSLECPEGYEIVNGKCVPIESSAAPTDTSSSAAQ